MIEEQMIEDDLGIMKSPSLWPQWPLLPLTNKKTNEDGFIVDTEKNQYRVYKGNMWDLHGNLYSLPFEDFDSAQSILSNGWKVD